MEFIDKIELEFCTVSLRADGIIENRFVWDSKYEIGQDHILAISQAIQELSNNQPKPILSVAGQYGSMTPEARTTNINNDAAYTLALALVIPELSQRILANFYFKVKKIVYPVKTFKLESEAVDWLEQQMKAEQLAS